MAVLLLFMKLRIAMAIMGYDDSEQCWIIKNSWGTGWGENGWVRMSYDDLWIGEWYGKGTGVMYLGDVYGNLEPDVPYIQITQPTIYHTYINGREFPTIFRKIPFIQEGAPRILGELTVKVNASNTVRVEFYLDGELKYTDDEQPYEWNLESRPGLHTIETYAYGSNGAVSKDIVDVFVI